MSLFVNVSNNSYTEPSERNTAVLAHLLPFCGLVIPFGNILGPLILWLIKRDTSNAAAIEAKESLNFQITTSLIVIGLSLLAGILVYILIGFLLFPVIGLYILWVGIAIIVAGVKASEGCSIKYKMTLRLVS